MSESSEQNALLMKGQLFHDNMDELVNLCHAMAATVVEIKDNWEFNSKRMEEDKRERFCNHLYELINLGNAMAAIVADVSDYWEFLNKIFEDPEEQKKKLKQIEDSLNLKERSLKERLIEMDKREHFCNHLDELISLVNAMAATIAKIRDYWEFLNHKIEDLQEKKKKLERIEESLNIRERSLIEREFRLNLMESDLGTLNRKVSLSLQDCSSEANLVVEKILKRFEMQMIQLLVQQWISSRFTAC